MRKVYVELKVKLTISINEDTSIEDVLQEMDYDFVASPDTNATIEDMEILEQEITDSKLAI